MSDYLVRLLTYIDRGGQLIQPPNKPVFRNLVEMLADYVSSQHEAHDEGVEHVYGTNMRRVRTGLVLERVIDGVWYVMLGRKCDKISDIMPGAVLKTAGGYAKFFRRIAEKDPSVKRALIREMKEEGFGGPYRLRSDSVVPISVSPANPEGVLQFYIGRLKHYPVFDERGIAIPCFPKVDLHMFKRFQDGKRIFVNYFTIDEVLELARPDVALVHRETVEAVIDAYFWQKGTKLHMCPKHNDFAIDGGDLAIPPGLRQNMFSRLGIPARDDRPRLRRCGVYYSLPHQVNIPALRMFLVTDLFVYAKEFDEAEIHDLLGGAGKMKSLQDAAPKVMVNYLRERYEELLHHDLFASYISPR